MKLLPVMDNRCLGEIGASMKICRGIKKSGPVETMVLFPRFGPGDGFC